MYYLQSRYYDPVVKRMLCADDESLLVGATLENNNLLAYCNNNPVCNADTEGEIPIIVVGAVVGAASNVAVQMLGNYLSGEKITQDIGEAAITGAVSGALNMTGISYVSNIAVNALTQGAVTTIKYISQNGGIPKTNSGKTKMVKTVLIDSAFAAANAAIPTESHVRKQKLSRPKAKTAKKKWSLSSKTTKAFKTSAVKYGKKISKKHFYRYNLHANHKHIIKKRYAWNTYTSMAWGYFFSAWKTKVKK